jgi:hypothetical protein
MLTPSRSINVEARLTRLLGGQRLAIAIGLAAAVAAGALALWLTDSFSPHGVVYGTFMRCDADGDPRAIVAGCSGPNPRARFVPAAGAKVQLRRVANDRVYTAVTDPRGNYLISVPAGRYLLQGYFAPGQRAEVTVTAGQRVEFDLQYW